MYVCNGNESLLGDLLEETGQVRLLILQELYLVLALLRLNFTSLSVAEFDSIDLSLQFNDLVVKFGAFSLKLNDALFQV